MLNEGRCSVVSTLCNPTDVAKMYPLPLSGEVLID